MLSTSKIDANRRNAQLSTGPRSIAGKEIASLNAERHGIFSNRLFLNDENPDEFALLVSELQETLTPVGATELNLVERIAVTIWRQRRLIAAETATLELSRESRQVADAVSAELQRGFGHEVTENDLQPIDEEQSTWCTNIINEIENLDVIDSRSIEKLAPLAFEQLKLVASEDAQEPDEYLEDYDGGLTGFLSELMRWCSKQLDEASERPRILAMAEKVRQKRVVLPEATLALFSRYQTTLDNQLLKTLKALRDAQEWRLKNLESISNNDEPVIAAMR